MAAAILTVPDYLTRSPSTEPTGNLLKDRERTWDDVTEGAHLLRITGGVYGGASFCGFWFSSGGRQVKVTVRNAQSEPVSIFYYCD